MEEGIIDQPKNKEKPKFKLVYAIIPLLIIFSFIAGSVFAKYRILDKISSVFLNRKTSVSMSAPLPTEVPFGYLVLRRKDSPSIEIFSSYCGQQTVESCRKNRIKLIQSGDWMFYDNTLGYARVYGYNFKTQELKEIYGQKECHFPSGCHEDYVSFLKIIENKLVFSLYSETQDGQLGGIYWVDLPLKNGVQKLGDNINGGLASGGGKYWIIGWEKPIDFNKHETTWLLDINNMVPRKISTSNVLIMGDEKGIAERVVGIDKSGKIIIAGYSVNFLTPNYKYVYALSASNNKQEIITETVMPKGVNGVFLSEEYNKLLLSESKSGGENEPVSYKVNYIFDLVSKKLSKADESSSSEPLSEFFTYLGSDEKALDEIPLPEGYELVWKGSH